MTHQVVRIRADSWDQLRDLQRVYDLDVFRQTAKQSQDRQFEIHGLLSDQEVQLLTSKVYRIEPIADAETIARARLREVSGCASEIPRRHAPEGPAG